MPAAAGFRRLAMIFASDNWAGASGKILAAAAAAAQRGGPAYGYDQCTETVGRRFTEIFERDVSVFFVGSGTAANALALSAYARPGGVVFTHEHAHANLNEAGGTEFVACGAKVIGLAGPNGKILPETLAMAIARYPQGNSHRGIPFAVSLTQPNELGLLYQPAEIAAIAAVAHRHGLIVHLDGARFAGAVAALRCPPAETSWRVGVDVMSFGGTKNGCLLAEAVVFFHPAQASGFGFSRQRIGHGFSKGWFLAAQFDAYLDNDHWLDLARHANACAQRLAAGIRRSNTARVAIAPDTNQIFAILPKVLDERLRHAGATYHPWPPDTVTGKAGPAEGQVLVRLVTSFQTTDEEVESFARLLTSARGSRLAARKPIPQRVEFRSK